MEAAVRRLYNGTLVSCNKQIEDQFGWIGAEEIENKSTAGL
jgi:hypothetical protein